MAEHVFGVHKGVQTEEIETEIPLSKLKRYIAYCRNKCTPRLSDEAAELLNNEYVNMRNLLRGKEAEGQNVPIPITVRQLEAIIRLSESLAKMTLSDTVYYTKFHSSFNLIKCRLMKDILKKQLDSSKILHWMLLLVV